MVRITLLLLIGLSTATAWAGVHRTKTKKAGRVTAVASRAPKGAPSALPFQPGEKLTYKLTWMAIPVGHATLEVRSNGRFRGRPAWQFHMSARTNKFADALYKVRDELHSWAPANMRRSLHHKKRQREGSYRRDVVLHFDWRKRRVVYANGRKAYKPRKLYRDTFDPLGLLYGFRRHRITRPQVLVMSATDGLKTIRAKVHVVGRETIEVGDRRWRTWKVVPELKDVEGVFKRSKDSEMEVWFSDDHRRLPVRLRSKVMIGSFTATLVDHQGVRP